MTDRLDALPHEQPLTERQALARRELRGRALRAASLRASVSVDSLGNLLSRGVAVRPSWAELVIVVAELLERGELARVSTGRYGWTGRRRPEKAQ